MAAEYILLLIVSTMILAGAFGLSSGPVGVFRDSGPILAKKVERGLASGEGFRPASAPWQQP